MEAGEAGNTWESQATAVLRVLPDCGGTKGRHTRQYGQEDDSGWGLGLPTRKNKEAQLWDISVMEQRQ